MGIKSFAQLPDYIPQNGLVAHWPLDGDATDVFGNVHNGTVSGTSLTNDRNGNPAAMQFDGIDDIVVIPHHADLNFTTEMTLNFWIRGTFDLNWSDSCYVLGKRDYNDNMGWWIDMYKDPNSPPSPSYTEALDFDFHFNTDSVGGQIDFQENPMPWNMFTYSFNNGTIKVFMDGLLIFTDNTVNTVLPINSLPLIFGAITNTPSSNFFAGKLDDITLWNKALPDCDIRSLFYDGNDPLTSVTVMPDAITADQGSAVYEWLDCDNNYAVLTQETTQSLTPSSAGNYAVSVTYDGCTDTSDCYFIGAAGIEELAASFKIAPNPANDHIDITWEGQDAELSVQILDFNGRMIREKKITKHKNRISVSDLKDGIYILYLPDSNRSFKIIKN